MRKDVVQMERLDKLTAKLLEISRKEARSLILSGRVTLQGTPLCDADFKTDGTGLAVDGKNLLADPFICLMMNKPEGVISATKDALSATVLELLPAEYRRKGLFPAGRLDKDSTGFLLITDDGQLAHRLLSPKRHVEKEYRVRLARPFENGYIQAFLEGVELEEEGRLLKCMPAVCSPLDSPYEAKAVIKQGIYHQIKRMFAAVGNHVEALERVRIGGLPLDPNLRPGQSKLLTPEEVLRLEAK